MTVGVGSGFTGRLAMGVRPLPWAFVARYVQAVKGLLQGEQVLWDDALIQMIHPDGFAPERPIRVPFIIGASGPKGIAVAREVGDGVFGAPAAVTGFDTSIILAFGTVLDDGEDPGCERSIAAAGHSAAVLMHWATEHNHLDLIPDAERWQAAYDDVPPPARHLALHAGHLVEVTEQDRPSSPGSCSSPPAPPCRLRGGGSAWPAPRRPAPPRWPTSPPGRTFPGSWRPSPKPSRAERRSEAGS